MSDYFTGLSSYGSSLWNPQIPNFAAGQGASPYALPAPIDYSADIKSFSNPLPGAVDVSFADRLRSWGVLDSKNANGTMTQGWGIPALGAAQGLFNGWMGLKQYGLFKEQLGEQKRQFGLNYDAQVKTTNSALEDRQRARVASNPGAYQSVGDYMAANRIGG